MSVSLEIIAKNRTNISLLLFRTAVISFFLLLLSVFILDNKPLIIITLSVFAASFITASFAKAHIPVGNLKITKDSFTIKMNETERLFQVVMLRKVKISVAPYHGERGISNIVSFVGHSGLGGYIQFLDHKLERHKYEFFTKTSSQKQKIDELKSYLKERYPQSFI